MVTLEALIIPLIKILGAMLCGGLLGLERELHHKPAGLRTNILIATGSCIFVILSYEITKMAGLGDPGRIAAQIVTGIGFLGAGTIIQAKGIVKGLTSAATIWVVASLGMAVGMGLFDFAIIITFVILAVLLLLSKVEFAIGAKGQNKSSCTLTLSRMPTATHRVMTVLAGSGTTIEDLQISRSQGIVQVSFTHYGKKSKVEALHSSFAQMREIQDFQIEFFDFRVTR